MIDKKGFSSSVGHFHMEITVLAFVLLCSVVLSAFLYFKTVRLLSHQEEVWQDALALHEDPSECSLRKSYIAAQQVEAAECAEKCMRYLRYDYKVLTIEADNSRIRCLDCLIAVETPMPFDVANPSYEQRFR